MRKSQPLKQQDNPKKRKWNERREEKKAVDDSYRRRFFRRTQVEVHRESQNVLIRFVARRSKEAILEGVSQELEYRPDEHEPPFQ